MGREDYMAPYPALVAFLDQHPEIKRNPSYYLQRYANDYGGLLQRSPFARLEEHVRDARRCS